MLQRPVFAVVLDPNVVSSDMTKGQLSLVDGHLEPFNEGVVYVVCLGVHSYLCPDQSIWPPYTYGRPVVTHMSLLSFKESCGWTCSSLESFVLYMPHPTHAQSRMGTELLENHKCVSSAHISMVPLDRDAMESYTT